MYVYMYVRVCVCPRVRISVSERLSRRNGSYIECIMSVRFFLSVMRIELNHRGVKCRSELTRVDQIRTDTCFQKLQRTCSVLSLQTTRVQFTLAACRRRRICASFADNEPLKIRNRSSSVIQHGRRYFLTERSTGALLAQLLTPSFVGFARRRSTAVRWPTPASELHSSQRILASSPHRISSPARGFLLSTNYFCMIDVRFADVTVLSVSSGRLSVHE